MLDKPQYVLWDWHGVLGMKGFWYKTAKVDEQVNKLTNYIFSDQKRVDDWMRGSISIQSLIAESGTTVSAEQLSQYFMDDWAEKEVINTQLISTVQTIYPEAIHVIVTDNMDVFAEYYKTNKYLLNHFSMIFNSADYRVLKSDRPSLFEKVLVELQLDSFDNCLLLDDSDQNCRHFESLGGAAILVESKSR